MLSGKSVGLNTLEPLGICILLSHSGRRLCNCRPVSPWQSNGELSELADLAIDGDRAAMLLGHDVVADRKAEAGAFAGWLGREEGLKELVLDLRGNAGAVVVDADFNRIAEIPRR